MCGLQAAGCGLKRSDNTVYRTKLDSAGLSGHAVGVLKHATKISPKQIKDPELKVEKQSKIERRKRIERHTYLHAV